MAYAYYILQLTIRAAENSRSGSEKFSPFCEKITEIPFSTTLNYHTYILYISRTSAIRLSDVIFSDCNPEIEFLISGSRDPVSELGLQNSRCFDMHSRLIS